MEDPSSLVLLSINWNEVMLSFIISLLVLIILLILSGLVSGSEVAFFSLSPNEKEEIESKESRSAKMVLKLIDQPRELLAIILIANNFINIAIILVASFLSDELFAGQVNETVKFLIDVIVITFILLLFGEVIPKIYATKNAPKVSLLMSIPLYYVGRMFPFNLLKMALVGGTARLSTLLGRKQSVSISSDELEQALELTHQDEDPDQKILQGIVNFGNKDVKQIMKSRMDVLSFDSKMNYDELYEALTGATYSRIPIYSDSFDNIEGILHVKDLLPHIDAQPIFKWQSLLREPFFVPENKKIDDLLKNFQEMKMHLAIVVDEYGGKSGIVTLEDVLEEIVGDISDEFDEEDLVYSKLDENNFVFEGKTPLIDMYRVLEIDGSEFEDAKSESDTIAGFVIEQAGKILKKNERVTFENFTFTIEAADNRKVKRIKVTRTTPETEKPSDEEE